MELVLWGIIKLVGKFGKKNTNVPIPRVFSFLIVITGITVLGLETIVFQQDKIARSVKTMSMIFAVLIIIMLVYLYEVLAHNFEEKVQTEILKREKGYYLNQAEMLQQSYNQIRNLKHDMKNHIIALEAMEKSGESGKVLEYLQGLTDKLNSTTMYSNSGVTIIDSIINYKMSLAEQNGIAISSAIKLPDSLELNAEDMVIILGNILDNAIEANKYVKENPYMNLEIKYVKGNMVIILKNSFDGFINKERDVFITRKTDSQAHGIGLNNVKNIVEQYNGVLEISHNEKEFKVKIMIYSE